MIEMVIVVLVISILAATAMPQYAKVVEKGKIAEALASLNAIRGAEARYLNKYGAYCYGAVSGGCLDVNVATLKYFNAWPAVAAGAGSPSWKITVTRNQTTAFYGAYSLTYDIEPTGAPALTCSNASCTADLLPTIH